MKYFYSLFKTILSSSQQAIQNNTSENCRSIRIANTNYEIRREYLDNKEYKFVIFMDAIPCYEAFENDKSFSLIFITIDKKSYENKVIENDFESNVCRYKNGYSIVKEEHSNCNISYTGTKVNSQKNGFGCIYNGDDLDYIGFFKDDKRYGFGISYDKKNNIYWNDLRISDQDVKRDSNENPIEIDIYNNSPVLEKVERLFTSSYNLQFPEFPMSFFTNLKQLVICENCSKNNCSPCKTLYISNMSVQSIIIEARSLISIEEMIVENCWNLNVIEIGVPGEDNYDSNICLEKCQLFKFHSIYLIDD